MAALKFKNKKSNKLQYNNKAIISNKELLFSKNDFC
jgi:hypothetical protein